MENTEQTIMYFDGATKTWVEGIVSSETEKKKDSEGRQWSFETKESNQLADRR